VGYLLINQVGYRVVTRVADLGCVNVNLELTCGTHIEQEDYSVYKTRDCLCVVCESYYSCRSI
jgi:hypothetical protein